MAVSIDTITWSNLQASNNNTFAKIGVYIEDRTNSLEDGTRDTVLDISVWFQANKEFIQKNGHILTINGQQKEVLPIEAAKDEATLIYFETISIPKLLSGYFNNNQEVFDITINVTLSNINNFIENFSISETKTSYVLNSYLVTFIKKLSEKVTTSLDLTMTKYHTSFDDNNILYPFYLYKNDFENYMLIEENNIKYKLVSIINDNINFRYNLDKQRSKPIITNDIVKLSFYLVYEEIKYDITYNGNGGQTQNEETEITLPRDEASPKFFRNGYEQVGWSYSSSIYGESVELDTIPKNRNIILYAKWKPNIIHITYKSNNVNASEIPEGQDFEYNEVSTISNQIPKLDKYIFLRWKDSDNNYYYPNEIVSLTNDLNLIAEWEPLTYTVQYILPNGEKKIYNFMHDNGLVQEIMDSSGKIYKYFSYAIDDNIPDKQVGDKLENYNHTLYAMTHNQVNVVYSYHNDITYTEIKNIYNHNNILQKYKPRQPMLYIINKVVNENEETKTIKQYFQYWIDASGQKYSPNLYYTLPLITDDNNNIQDIIFTAVYGDNEYIEHNIIITKDNGISLIAENFNEDNTLIKSKYSVKIDNDIMEKDGFIFFKQGEVTAKQFNEINETDEKVEYNIGSKETGIFNFNNYIQETRLKKQLLQISLNALDGDNLGYVVLEDYDSKEEDPLDTAENDIYISL